ncbi:hydrogenase nickel insertion protein HypA [Archaeoglobus sulfaticallidus PM70-1]|uniref:Hydrogenase nickel insertion protein HypA n=1 Tax=Archaeoglobus sulfaticallidus PM70-1 TaxID=387631 RepID=N0BDF2_9EURY|nr:hydrogenase maturation nickel metallochaperone HypA [Archaeoglobus sulfaticallidus]AGK60287.1 hydrogenase nickel insertion protein HypA [Archaeoglobus sulfaticallidus PM70-1]
MSFASAIVENALKLAEKHNAKKVNSITVIVGELLLINPDQLEFCYSVASKGTILENSKLIIEVSKAEIKCVNCGERYDSPIYLCEKCGGFVSVNGGKDMILKKIEMEGN